jgi:ABC-type multidrug transport system fused ATPase/permease subunit
MDDGMVLEKGTHEALVKANGYYANLLRTQQMDAGLPQYQAF